ncbi:chemotaxis protein CheA [Hahella sp. SMD15-11]|uniref:Chemotaxis protein CheA n=1 Tax=Thermohahella caldifontis TaxID=3142973 RepID=A0AB39UT81_9GAMM
MSIDLSQFHAIFFEESFENVDVLEQGLLALDVNTPDAEAINTIFRAAHSIKGGAGTFGFQAVADFTHVMENLLDRIRSGQRALDQDVVDILLGSVDCLRMLLTAAREGSEPDRDLCAAQQARLEAALSGRDPAPASPAGDKRPAPDPEPAGVPVQTGWRIVFQPHPELAQRGNDPLRLIRELMALAPATVTCETSLLPAWPEYDPTRLELSWTIILNEAIPRHTIEEVFSWVEDECDLALVPVLGSPETSSGEAGGRPATAPTAAAPTTPAPAADTEAASPAGEGDGQVTPRDAPKPATETAPRPRTPVTPVAAASQSIRVDLPKVDALINMVGELVITQSMLNMLRDEPELQGYDRLHEGLAQLQRQTRALQEGVMQIRMLPISFCFSRFPRMVRDLSRQLGKDIELVMSGENTEVDKTVIEKITDPLVHLVRNSIDHGIEPPEAREAAGKPRTGHVWLRAYHQVGNIVIEVADDGGGIHRDRVLQKARERGVVPADARLTPQQIDELIFEPGFSTQEAVTDLSGRGVGMDVVRRNVQALGGSISVESEAGKGTTFIIRLPLTLAIMDGQLVRVGDETYIIPLVSVVESLEPDRTMIHYVGGDTETIKLRGEYVPVIRLAEILGVHQPMRPALEDGIVVIVETDRQRYGIFVDDLLNQQQIVIKSLEDNYRRVPGMSGATILGDGRVALILDVDGLMGLLKEKEAAAHE